MQTGSRTRAANACMLTPAFTAPADYNLDSCSPDSVLSELDGSLELDGLMLGPEFAFLLEHNLSPSPSISDTHLLDHIDKVRISRHRALQIVSLRSHRAGLYFGTTDLDVLILDSVRRTSLRCTASS